MAAEDRDEAVSKFREATARLREGVRQAKDELDKDGVIQRFEFTFELFWKALKIYFENEGIPCKTPRECLKAAFRYEIVQDEQLYVYMLEDRNKTSHIYGKEESERIFQKIKSDYVSAFEKVADVLVKKTKPI